VGAQEKLCISAAKNKQMHVVFTVGVGIFFGLAFFFRGKWVCPKKNQVVRGNFFMSPVTRFSAGRVASRRWSTTSTGWMHACGLRTYSFASHWPTLSRRRILAGNRCYILSFEREGRDATAAPISGCTVIFSSAILVSSTGQVDYSLPLHARINF